MIRSVMMAMPGIVLVVVFVRDGELAPAVGLEPTTRGLTVRCSTN